MVEQPCAGCRQVWTTDGSGLCEDCQADVISQRPGSITDDQRAALIGALIEQGFVGDGKWTDRAALLTSVLAGWAGGSDLGNLSQQQAGDLLEYLTERRLSQEARRL